VDWQELCYADARIVMQEEAAATAGVQIGSVLALKYRIERVLGVGGMGVVVAAYHVHLDERVAIKFLLPEALKDREAVARFVREARAAVKIKSEHVARVIDVGTMDNGSPFMVMEYLDGLDLSEYVRQNGPLGIEKAVEFVLQACEAIAEAHSLGIIHRDLKPSNLFCVRGADGLEAIKVLDFGISKVSGTGGLAAHAVMTRTAAVFGSPLYMSPEQMLSSRDVDCRTDIWALASILYELLTGRSPFEGETLPEIYARVSSQPPRPLRDCLPSAPLGLQTVIETCLEKDRTKRYSNVAELCLALAPFASLRGKASIERVTRVVRSSADGQVIAYPVASDAVDPPAAVGTSAAWGATAMTLTGLAKSPAVAIPTGLIVALMAIVAILATRRGPADSTSLSRASAAGDTVAHVVSPPVAPRETQLEPKQVPSAEPVPNVAPVGSNPASLASAAPVPPPKRAPRVLAAEHVNIQPLAKKPAQADKPAAPPVTPIADSERKPRTAPPSRHTNDADSID
jgi:serine/threonine-protein kinase